MVGVKRMFIAVLAIGLSLVAPQADAMAIPRLAPAPVAKRMAPIEKAQYFSFGDNDYCWYYEGWNGPGWYVCGSEWDSWVAWGGPYGWNGWGDGRRLWRFRKNRVGVWHPGPPSHGSGPGWKSGPGAGHPVVNPAGPGSGFSVPHFGDGAHGSSFGGGFSGFHGGGASMPSFGGGFHGGGHR